MKGVEERTPKGFRDGQENTTIHLIKSHVENDDHGDGVTGLG